MRRIVEFIDLLGLEEAKAIAKSSSYKLVQLHGSELVEYLSANPDRGAKELRQLLFGAQKLSKFSILKKEIVRTFYDYIGQESFSGDPKKFKVISNLFDLVPVKDLLVLLVITQYNLPQNKRSLFKSIVKNGFQLRNPALEMVIMNFAITHPSHLNGVLTTAADPFEKVTEFILRLYSMNQNFGILSTHGFKFKPPFDDLSLRNLVEQSDSREKKSYFLIGDVEKSFRELAYQNSVDLINAIDKIDRRFIAPFHARLIYLSGKSYLGLGKFATSKNELTKLLNYPLLPSNNLGIVAFAVFQATLNAPSEVSKDDEKCLKATVSSGIETSVKFEIIRYFFSTGSEKSEAWAQIVQSQNPTCQYIRFLEILKEGGDRDVLKYLLKGIKKGIPKTAHKANFERLSLIEKAFLAHYSTRANANQKLKTALKALENQPWDVEGFELLRFEIWFKKQTKKRR